MTDQSLLVPKVLARAQGHFKAKFKLCGIICIISTARDKYHDVLQDRYFLTGLLPSRFILLALTFFLKLGILLNSQCLTADYVTSTDVHAVACGPATKRYVISLQSTSTGAVRVKALAGVEYTAAVAL